MRVDSETIGSKNMLVDKYSDDTAIYKEDLYQMRKRIHVACFDTALLYLTNNGFYGEWITFIRYMGFDFGDMFLEIRMDYDGS
jgi:hypothetical protein